MAAAPAKAAALGLLQPLEALSLDADTLRTATAAAVAYCAVQGAASVADLVERASKLIVHTHRHGSYRLTALESVPVALAMGLRTPTQNCRALASSFLWVAMALLRIAMGCHSATPWAVGLRSSDPYAWWQLPSVKCQQIFAPYPTNHTGATCSTV